jgi:hypothetical protein
MFIVKCPNGGFIAKIDSSRHTLNQIKGTLRRGETVWYRFPVERVVETQMLHHKDKVSRVRDKVASARVGGQHSSMLVHKVETGEMREQRVW